MSTISEVFTILRINSWFKVDLLVASGIALLLWRTMSGTMLFSKYWKIHLLASVILISKSKVGNHPSNMSSVSIVSLNHPHTLFIMSLRTLVVFCNSVKPIPCSSSFQTSLYCNTPLVTLQPSLMALNHIRMSSMYLAPASTFKFILSMTSRSWSSHQSIVSLAMQQVLLSPIGPPTCCRKNFWAKLYVWHLNIASTAVFMKLKEKYIEPTHCFCSHLLSFNAQVTTL